MVVRSAGKYKAGNVKPVEAEDALLVKVREMQKKREAEAAEAATSTATAPAATLASLESHVDAGIKGAPLAAPATSAQDVLDVLSKI